MRMELPDAGEDNADGPGGIAEHDGPPAFMRASAGGWKT